MANKMLIDAAHPEETRVVVVRGNRVEEFDFEAENKKQLRGNIYLAKVTRVEPSLQAAFVDYGGNRHGFLAFSEIHPDYYQIPMADRQALMDDDESGDDESGDDENDDTDDTAEQDATPAKASSDDDDDADGDDVEMVGAEDALEEVPERRSRKPKQYKIQEVIRRRQILLVQVVKEERGNKGAALTTYLSLAGRYSVLMPNTARGGGISRKITNPTDRKRLKKIASELDVVEGMGVILRTAGAARTKAEIKRDFEYLMRLWETVRDLTLKSTAPLLVYEEGSLIKRSIRDLYNKDISEVLVAGDEGYKEAKSFMRMLMPSHAKNVQPYRDEQPIFTRYRVEPQLDAMFSPQVTLPSGGYLVINQTEALVAIDVNSGKATKEHSIEDTALKTNLEAAEEVARQLRLRDLAGLVVIDFIDMEEKRNNRAVERKLKECLKSDRARIQVGRISHFGLLEMSRQRIRTGVLESSTEVCPHCEGNGHIRASSSVALHVLRTIEDTLLRGVTANMVVRTPTAVALYILNQKRRHLMEIEDRFGLTVDIVADDSVGNNHCALEKGTPLEEPVPPAATVVQPDTFIDDIAQDDSQDDEQKQASEGGGKKRRRRRRRRKSSSGDQSEQSLNAETDGEESAESSDASASTEDQSAKSDDEDEDGNRGKKPRRRGRRGGRRNRKKDSEDSVAASDADGETENGSDSGTNTDAGADTSTDTVASEETAPAETTSADADGAAEGADSSDATFRSSEPDTAASSDEPESTVGNPDEHAAEGEKSSEEAPVDAAAEQTEAEAEAVSDAAPVAADPVSEAEQDADAPVNGAPKAEAEAEPKAATPEPEAPPQEPEAPAGPKRSGWWQRRSFF
ncbi:ribonuclease E/G [Coralliovum pocilloporae]|uniref:ribonuclease E/G n=1 Tax=Coralliovum pocilloporae TaxID=3066369 RepID=UPI0033079807